MEHYKITHFYANNKQSTDNKAIPIGDYPPEDIQNVSKKVILNPKIHTFKLIVSSVILRQSFGDVGSLNLLRGLYDPSLCLL